MAVIPAVVPFTIGDGPAPTLNLTVVADAPRHGYPTVAAAPVINWAAGQPRNNV